MLPLNARKWGAKPPIAMQDSNFFIANDRRSYDIDVPLLFPNRACGGSGVGTAVYGEIWCPKQEESDEYEAPILLG